MPISASPLVSEGALQRPLSFLLRRLAPITPADPDQPLGVYDPVAVKERLDRWRKRRLSDDLQAVIETACLGGDFETADDLLVVLQRKVERDFNKFPRGRNRADNAIQCISIEIQNRKAIKQHQSDLENATA